MVGVLAFRDSLTDELIYKDNQYSIQKYNDDYYRMICFKKLKRTAGYELPFDKLKCNKKGDVNEDKLKNNIYRAKGKIFEYALCNDWKYFCTFTINGDKYPRDDIKAFYKVFSKWLLNYQRSHGKIKYLIIPELHKDKKNWHFHGLMDIDSNLLTKFIADKHPDKLVNSNYKNWEDYEKKFGFCSFGIIKNSEACSKYITKYVTKNLYNDDKTVNKIALNQQLYYCSKGLQTKEIIKAGNVVADIPAFTDIKFDFENDYVKLKSFNKETILNYL